MEKRTNKLPPDIIYALDQGVSDKTLTTGAYMACIFYGDTAAIDAIINASYPGRGWERLANMMQAVEIYGHSIIEQLPDWFKAACLGSSTASLLVGMNEYAEYMSWQVFEDCAWGGCSIERHSDRIKRNGDLDKKLHRKLYSGKFVKRFVANYHLSEAQVKNFGKTWEIHGRRLHAPSDDIMAVFAGAYAELSERTRERHLAFMREYNAEKQAKIPKGIKKKRRRATVKAAALASAIIGASTVSAFARGEPVRMKAGDDISIEAKLASSAHGGGHGALEVSLLDGANNFLSNLCIYQDLPAFDQLASLALHAQSDSIGDVIATGNLYKTAPNALEHPRLVGKKTRDIIGMEIMVDPASRIERLSEFEWRRVLVKRYENAMVATYRNRLFIEVFGRQAKHALQIFETLERKTYG